MHSSLKKHWDRIQYSKEYYDALLKVFNDEQLNFKPDENSWSMLEVMQHLYTSESISLNFVKKFDFNRKSEKLGFKSQFYTILLVNRLNSKKKFKAPKVLSDKKNDLEISDDPHKFYHQWEEKRNEMKEILENFPQDKLNYFTFSHPAVGKLKIGQMLQFFNAHLKHHQYQIETINHHPNFPV